MKTIFFILLILPICLNGQYFSPRFVQMQSNARLVDVVDMNNDGSPEVLFDAVGDFLQVDLYKGTYRARSLKPNLGGEDLPLPSFLNKNMVKIGDLDGNGYSDIVVSDGVSQLYRYMLQPDETYLKLVVATDITGDAFPFLKDVDRDGDLDIAVMADNKFRIYTNINNSSFELTTTFTLTNQDVLMYIADFDADAKEEFVIIRKENSSRFSVNFYRYDSTLKTLVSLNIHTNILSGSLPYLLFADIDNDNDLDIMASTFGSSAIVEYINNGGLTFTATTQNLGLTVQYPILLNMDNIGGLEIFVIKDYLLTILQKNAEGKYIVVRSLPLPDYFGYTDSYNILDYDKDGDLDILTDLYFFENIDSWSAADTHILLAYGEYYNQALDFDLDGDTDIIFGSRRGLGFEEQTSPWNFTIYQIPIAGYSYSDKLQPIQYDADPDIELLVKRSPDSLFLIDRTGDLKYEQRFLFRLSLPRIENFLGSDLDKDGDIDLVHYSTSFGKNLEWYENKGSDQFVQHTLFDEHWWVKGCDILDYDADGDPDIIAAIYLSGSPDRSQIRFYENDGTGNFVFHILISELRVEYTSLFIHDINGDGEVEMVVDVNDVGKLQTRALFKRTDGTYFIKKIADHDANLCHMKLTSTGEEIYIYNYDWETVGWYRLDKFLQPDDHYFPNWGQDASTAIPADFDGDGDLDLFFETTIDNPHAGISDYMVYENVVRDSVPFTTVHVFIDKNKNGIKDAPDETFGQHTIRFSPDGYEFITSQDDVDYQMDYGIHQIELKGYDKNLWDFTTGGPVQILHVDKDHVKNDVWFGLTPKKLEYKIRVDLTVGSTFCNRTAMHYLMLRNVGTINLDSLQSIFNYDHRLGFIETYPDPLSVTTTQVIHHIDEFNVNSDNKIFVRLQMPDETHVNEVYKATSQVTLQDSVGVTHSFYDTVGYYLHCAVDPNSISVTPKNGTPGYILDSPSYLEYLVRFQNDGNAPAENIRVENTLPVHLELDSFQLLSSSHGSNLEVRLDLNTKKLIFDFLNIHLPDTASNFAESEGFVKYRIYTKDLLNVGTQVTNSAKIYFDLNQPILTNIEKNTVTTCSALNQISISVDSAGNENKYSISIANPILDSVKWMVNGNVIGDSTIVNISVPNTSLTEVQIISYSALCEYDTIFILGTTAIGDFDRFVGKDVLLFPNATKNHLQFSTEEYDLLKPVSFIIINSVGQQVGTIQHLRDNFIDVSQLEPQVYTILFNLKDGNVRSARFVKI